MKPIKSLLVVHDDETRLAVDEILAALGHKYDTAFSLAEAKELLTANGYAYMLTDYEIPARPGGKPRMQNTEHLLAQTSKVRRDMPPVVVIANRLAEVDDEDKFRWAADMRSRGATTFICRPFRTGGRTLDRVIEKLLAGQTEGVRMASVPSSLKEPAVTNDSEDSAVRVKAGKAEASKEIEPESKRSAPAAPPTDGRLASVPNEPVELDEFMAKFCEHRTRENRMYRKRALLAAARHGTVTLPPLATPRKHGQSNKHYVHDLLAAWQGFLDEGIDLPHLRPPFGNHGDVKPGATPVP
jgi:hypothetical protein